MQLDPVLAGVTGSGDDEISDPTHREARNLRRLPVDAGQQLPRVGTLHGEHRTGACDVGEADRAVGVRDAFVERGEHLVGVGRVGHDEEAVGVDPPHDDVVDHVGIVGIEEVGVLGASGFDLAEIVREQPLQQLERTRTVAFHGSEMGDVEHDRARAARPVLLEHARVLQGHVPSTEGDHARAERPMPRVERTATQGFVGGGPVVGEVAAHALSAAESGVNSRGRRPRSNGTGGFALPSSPASTSWDGNSSPYFTSRCR